MATEETHAKGRQARQESTSILKRLRLLQEARNTTSSEIIGLLDERRLPEVEEAFTLPPQVTKRLQTNRARLLDKSRLNRSIGLGREDRKKTRRFESSLDSRRSARSETGSAGGSRRGARGKGGAGNAESDGNSDGGGSQRRGRRMQHSRSAPTLPLDKFGRPKAFLEMLSIETVKRRQKGTVAPPVEGEDNEDEPKIDPVYTKVQVVNDHVSFTASAMGLSGNITLEDANLRLYCQIWHTPAVQVKLHELTRPQLQRTLNQVVITVEDKLARILKEGDQLRAALDREAVFDEIANFQRAGARVKVRIQKAFQASELHEIHADALALVLGEPPPPKVRSRIFGHKKRDTTGKITSLFQARSEVKLAHGIAERYKHSRSSYTEQESEFDSLMGRMKRDERKKEAALEAQRVADAREAAAAADADKTKSWYKGPVKLGMNLDDRYRSGEDAVTGSNSAGLDSWQARMTKHQSNTLLRNLEEPSPYMLKSQTLENTILPPAPLPSPDSKKPERVMVNTMREKQDATMLSLFSSMRRAREAVDKARAERLGETAEAMSAFAAATAASGAGSGTKIPSPAPSPLGAAASISFSEYDVAGSPGTKGDGASEFGSVQDANRPHLPPHEPSMDQPSAIVEDWDLTPSAAAVDAALGLPPETGGDDAPASVPSSTARSGSAAAGAKTGTVGGAGSGGGLAADAPEEVRADPKAGMPATPAGGVSLHMDSPMGWATGWANEADKAKVAASEPYLPDSKERLRTRLEKVWSELETPFQSRMTFLIEASNNIDTAADVQRQLEHWEHLVEALKHKDAVRNLYNEARRRADQVRDAAAARARKDSKHSKKAAAVAHADAVVLADLVKEGRVIVGPPPEPGVLVGGGRGRDALDELVDKSPTKGVPPRDRPLQAVPMGMGESPAVQQARVKGAASIPPGGLVETAVLREALAVPAETFMYLRDVAGILSDQTSLPSAHTHSPEECERFYVWLLRLVLKHTWDCLRKLDKAVINHITYKKSNVLATIRMEAKDCDLVLSTGDAGRG